MIYGKSVILLTVFLVGLNHPINISQRDSANPQVEHTPDDVTRASKTERQNIHKGPVDWKIEAVGPAGPIKYGSSPVFSIRITNLSVHDADFFEGIGTGNRQFEEDVLDDKEKPIAAMPPSFSADSDCDPCDEFVLHPGDEWRTKTTLPPWDLKAMLPGTYWVRFSKYDAVDHTKDWSNRVSVTVVP